MSDKKDTQTPSTQAPRRSRRRWSVEEKREILTDQEKSGLAASTYMKKMNLPQGSIYAWRKILNKINPRNPKTTGFLPVSLKSHTDKTPGDDSNAVPPILLQVSSALSLKIPAGFAEDQLNAILNILERRSC